MSAETANMRRVEVELPDEAFARTPWEPDRVAEELRVLWFLDQVRHRRLGFGKAAELAGVPLASFLDLMTEHQITPFDYDPEELERELG